MYCASGEDRKICWNFTEAKIHQSLRSSIHAIKYSFLVELKPSYNHRQNMCGLFHVLAQFPFTTKEPELDYYRQQVKVRVASRFAQQLKTLGK